MEGSHSASPGPRQQDDSWTCQRCGWVYPNAHPSAKHRRNHKKQCGKIKGFELQSELHKGGSSDEASSDDGSHANKESLPLQSSQIQHDSIQPLEAGSEILVVEPPSDLQSRELPLPETNVSNAIKSEAPLHGISASTDVKPEVPAYELTRDVDLLNVIKSASPAPEHVPIVVALDKTFGDGKDVKIKDLPVEPTDCVTSEIPQAHGLASQAGGLDVAVQDSPGLFSNQDDRVLEKVSILEGAAPASLNETSKTLEEEGRMSLPPCGAKVAQECEVLGSDQARETQTKEVSTTPTEQSINRQASSQDYDSWTCRRCGWVYPNPHPSAKHRRNHKKFCGKLKGFEAQVETRKGGSSDEVSSDEDKKEHIQHHSPQVVQVHNQASDTKATDIVTSVEDLESNNSQSRDLFTSKGDSSAGGLPDTGNVESVTTSIESSDVDPKYTVFQNLRGGGQGEGGTAVDHTTKITCESDGQGIFQTRKELPSNQVAVSVISEGLSNPVKDISNEFGSTHKAAEDPRELSGNSTPNIGNIPSVLNVMPSDGSQAADVSSNKAEGDDMGAVPMPITELRDSCLASESLEAFSGGGCYQDVDRNEKTDEATEPDLVKANSLAEEFSHDKPSSDLSPVLKADSSIVEEAESLPVEGSSVRENVLPIVTLPTAPDGTLLANDSNSKEKSVSVQAISNPVVELLPKDEVSGEVVGGLEDASSRRVPKTESSGVEEAESLPVEGSSVRENVLPIVTLPIAADGSRLANESNSKEKSVSVQAMPNPVVELLPKDEVSGQVAGGLEEESSRPVLKAESSVVEQAESLPVEGSSVRKNVLPLVRLPIAADGTCLANDSNSKAKSVSVQAIPNPVVELLPKDEVSGQVVGGLKDASSCIDKQVEAPQVAEMPMDNPGISVGESVPEKRTTLADTSAEAVSINDTLASRAFFSESKITPESFPLVSVGDTLVTSTKEELSGQIVGGLEGARAVETPQVTKIPVQSLDNSGTLEVGAVSEERTNANTAINDKTKTTNIASEFEVLEKAPSALVGDTLSRSTISNIANNSAISSLPLESDFKQLSLKDGHEDKTAEASGPLEVLEKPEIKDNTLYETDFESSDPSLDETDSFKKAESDFSQRSEFAASSHKLSDSLEIFEDAPDTLEACSVGGSVEENENLDEPRQVAEGVQEDSKPLGVASLDERVPDAIELEEQMLNVLNGTSAGEVSSEEKATMAPAVGTSYAVRDKMEELKAPSPEAWQEPGPSTSKKEGKRISTSEVMEDGKSNDSHTALRSLMAKEEKDKIDQVAGTSVAVDSKSPEKKEASTNVTKPKSKLRSFWSHCICCPAVH